MEHKDSTERCGFLRALLPLFTQEINCKTVRKCTKHAIVGQKLKIPDEEDYRINFSRAHVPPNLPGGLTSLALYDDTSCAVVAGGVRSEGASYAVAFMNVTTDKDKSDEVGFIQVMIVAINETMARVQARRPSTSVTRFTHAPSFFLIWGDTRSLRMPALRPASQMANAQPQGKY